MKKALPLPTLPVQVALEASLYQSMSSTRRLMERLHDMLSQRLDDLLRQLGVPGHAALGVTGAANLSPPLPLTLHVNQRPCHYPWEVTQRFYCYISGAVFDERIRPKEIADELRVWCSQADDDNAQTRGLELISLICVEAIKLQPSVLLGPEQLTAYREQLIASCHVSPPAASELTPERLRMLTWLEQVLGFALDHKLSITVSTMLPTSEMVAALLLRCWQQGMTHVYAAEELMDALVPKSAKIDLHFAPGYLCEVTDSHDVNTVEGFYGPRQVMYDKFGVSLPGFKFIENPTLKPRSFALRLNAHLLQPWVGLPSASESSTPRARLEYIVDALDRDLCANLHCLFPRWCADDYVSSFEQVFPTLLRMAKDHFDKTQRARVLRTLLADQVSLRNIRLILERMLDYEGDPNDLDQFGIFVRAGIARQSG